MPAPEGAAVLDVLIVGAGPTGLVLALWLTRLGARVRIIDKTATPGTTSRALAVQARTLELYRQAGLADAVLEGGRRIGGINLWVAGRRVAHAAFDDLGVGISPYSSPEIFPQDEHERLLIDRLARLGVAVERETALVDLAEQSDHVRATVARADGSTETVRAAYVAGCDGAHSTVRERLQIDFAGGTYEHLFYVADVQGRGAAINGELHAALDTTDFLAVFPLKGEGRARLVGTVRAGVDVQGGQLSWDDVSRRVIEWLRLDITRVNWLSTYRVHHRVADRFRKGRAFLLGDAAHIHSPVGGQGMNTGIGDAVNLAWKIAAVQQRRAHMAMLDTYEPERLAFARKLVATTDRAFSAVSSSSAIARLLRLRVVPLLIPPLFASKALRRFMFRTISQTSITYRGSALSQGSAGAVHGGDRLPWVQWAGDPGGDNFSPLTSLHWQVHVYGEPARAVHALCAARNLRLCAFGWREEMKRAGLRRDALYLVRPDGYVGLADPAADASTLAAYLDARGIVASTS